MLTGTLDEKVYQRQLLKADLAHAMMGATAGSTKAKFTRDELRELFALHEGTDCATRDLLATTGTDVWEVGASRCDGQHGGQPALRHRTSGPRSHQTIHCGNLCRMAT